MNCRNCGAPKKLVHGQDHFKCEYCQSLTFLTSIESSEDGVKPIGKTTEQSCPCCDESQLEIGLLDKSEVSFCKDCRGFLINSEALGFAIRARRDSYKGADAKPIPVDPEELKRERNCPSCQLKMNAHPYYGPGNSVIDSCGRCKLTWIDHGELTRIIRAPGRRGSATPRTVPMTNFSGSGSDPIEVLGNSFFDW